MYKLESLVYNSVRKNPAVKQAIRNLYQGFFDLLPRQKEILPLEHDYKEGYFFGFHDVSPLSEDESRLLACKIPFDLKMPHRGDGLEVGYFDFISGKLGDWHPLGNSFAWNYHKGCRLQWLDNTRIIFNSANDGQLSSIILDCTNYKTEIIPYPIDSIFNNGDVSLATSFSYERLERCMPGYGYPYDDDGKIFVSAPEETGLFLVDLHTKTRKLLISLKDIALQVVGKIEENYLHFVTHTEFSPDGHYISFLYRRIPKVGDYMKRKSVMCVYDRNRNRLIVLPTQESGSHYVWNDKNQLVASVNLDGRNCHALFSPDDMTLAKPIASDKINSDGHQSFINDTTFVTDTYPDKYRMAYLYKVNIETNEVQVLAKVYSPKQFQTKDFHCHIACDLHPRVIGNGKWVCFDSPRTGKRGINIIAVSYKPLRANET